MCGEPFGPPRTKFCSTRCSQRSYKGVKRIYGPVTGRSKDRDHINKRQRLARGWTEEDMAYGVKNKTDKYAPARRLGFRSMFEVTVFRKIEEAGLSAEYEPEKIPYTLDADYTPDFRLPNGIYIETKGRFKYEDKRKMKLVKEQHPDLDIRIVFQRSNTKDEKWCDKTGYTYAIGNIPLEWFKEKRSKSITQIPPVHRNPRLDSGIHKHTTKD